MFIELKNITVEMNGKTLLKDINLKLNAGEITAILGPSGSGLSILLKIASGLLFPTSGEVLYDGRSLHSFDAGQLRKLQTRTGFMFQDSALWANRTLAANLELPLLAKSPNLSAAELNRIVQDSLKRFHFGVGIQNRPVDISQGQKKFVSFLRAIIPGPEALFLDEPIAWMDRLWADKVIKELSALRTAGTTIAFASNQFESIFDLADNLVILHSGQITGQGKRDEILQSANPAIRAVLKGKTVE